MAKKLKITETVLRDAHQSLLATRMPLSDMLPILPELDKIGFYSLKTHGKDFVHFVRNVLTQSYRCYSVVRICLVTVTMLMMFLNILFRSQ